MKEVPRKKNLMETQSTSKTLDQTNIEEPSTSTGFKTHYAVNISVNPEDSKTIFTENESLSSLDELALQLLREKDNVEDDSFVTVDGCREERGTSTEPIAIFSRNEQVQNVIMGRSPATYYQPPPSYDPHDDLSAYRNIMGQPPSYHTVQTQVVMSQNPSLESQPYRRRYEVINVDDILDAFDSTQVKNRFVLKVYIIISCQLLLVFGITFFCIHEKNTRRFVQQDRIWYKVSLAVFIVSYMVMFRYKRARRIFPLNFALLLLMTLSMAHLAAAISCVYKTRIIMASFGVTSGVCLLISLLGFQQSVELTECSMALCLLYFTITLYFLIALVIFLITASSVNYLMYSCPMTLAFIMYLLYDTHQILEGQRIQILPGNYILAIVQIYVDILKTFISFICMFRRL